MLPLEYNATLKSTVVGVSPHLPFRVEDLENNMPTSHGRICVMLTPDQYTSVYSYRFTGLRGGFRLSENTPNVQQKFWERCHFLGLSGDDHLRNPHLHVSRNSWVLLPGSAHHPNGLGRVSLGGPGRLSQGSPERL